MRPLFSFLTLSLALVLGRLQPSLAVPNPSKGVSAPKLKESIPPPSNWIDLGRAPPVGLITLRIALPQARFSELESQLYEISDPQHARYGQHLMKEQVEELVRPEPSSVEAVDAWLAELDIPEGESIQRSRAGDWVTIQVPISQAEEMLDTEFHVWKHAIDGDLLIRTTQYSLPEHLHQHIELVQPTTYFGRPKPMSTNLIIDTIGISITIFPTPQPSPPGTLMDPYLGVNCTNITTVWCLQKLYNTDGYKPAATGKNKIGITGYLEEFANQADLQSFYHAERPDAIGSSFNTVLVNGGVNDQTLSKAGVEADLDTQFGFGISFPTPGTFFSTGGRPANFTPDALTPNNNNEPYLDWLQFMSGLPDGQVPQTISTSYSDDEQTVPVGYATRVCQEFAALGCRGVSIIFSSGDGGVGDLNPNPATQKCFSNDGTNRTMFIPKFPPSCPFVTTVGGTRGIPETAIAFSGGGFSNYFARPKYQDDAVNQYLASLPDGTYQGLFNPAGRAYPDVSAQSRRFLVYYKGNTALISGTSAAAPAFAGIVALLNDAMLAAGKPPLGFLNPLLYGAGAAGLNDITVGNNIGCGTLGFNATKGWDPVTGLGTPNFTKLKSILLSYPLPPLGGLLGGLLGAVKSLSLAISADVTVKLLSDK